MFKLDVKLWNKEECTMHEDVVFDLADNEIYDADNGIYCIDIARFIEGRLGFFEEPDGSHPEYDKIAEIYKPLYNTCCVDKDDVEIYTGYICEIDLRKEIDEFARGVVFFKEGSFLLWTEFGDCYLSQQEKLRVRGNIFENPELIDPVLIESYEALQ